MRFFWTKSPGGPMRRLCFLFTSFCLAGCVAITEPVIVGRDTYMIGLGARGGLTTDAELLTQTMRKAGASCLGQGRRMELRSATSSGTQGWTPQSNQVIFKCEV